MKYITREEMLTIAATAQITAIRIIIINKRMSIVILFNSYLSSTGSSAKDNSLPMSSLMLLQRESQ